MAPRKPNKKKPAANLAKGSAARAKQSQMPKARPAAESQAAEGVTVAWMLAAMGCGLAELVALLAMAATAFEPIAVLLPKRISVLPWLLLFVALITGTIALILTPLVLRQRQRPPPTSVVNFAVFVGVLAWALAIGSLWFPGE